MRDSGYLRKWLILGVAIGIIAGLGAVVFYLALDYTVEFLLGLSRRLSTRRGLRRRRRHRVGRIRPPWAIPLIDVRRRLVSAILVAKLAPEAEGHGTDSAIEAVHTDPARRSASARCW